MKQGITLLRSEENPIQSLSQLPIPDPTTIFDPKLVTEKISSFMEFSMTQCKNIFASISTYITHTTQDSKSSVVNNIKVIYYYYYYIMSSLKLRINLFFRSQ